MASNNEEASVATDFNERGQRDLKVILWVNAEIEYVLAPEQGRIVLESIEELHARAATNTYGELLVFEEDLVARIRDLFGIEDADLPRPIRDRIVIEYRDRFGFVPKATRDVLDIDPAATVEEALALPSARFAAGFMHKFAPGVPYRLVYRSVALSEQDEEDARYAADMRG